MRRNGVVPATIRLLVTSVVIGLGVVAAAVASDRLDESFGEGGVVFTPTAPERANGSANAVAIDASARIVVAGGADDHFVITRYLGDGSLDRSFGDENGLLPPAGDGVVEIGGWETANAQSARSIGIAFQGDGRLVVVGEWTLYGDPPHFDDRVIRRCFAVARLDSDGELDPSFGGGDGRFLACAGDRAFGVAIDAQGRIVVAGDGETPRGKTEAVVARYMPDGTVDPTFRGGGLMRRAGGLLHLRAGRRDAAFMDLALLPSGKILLSGHFGFNMMLARLTRTGALDTTFGSQGTAGISAVSASRGRCRCSIGWGLVRDQHRRTVVTGYVTSPNPFEYIAVARFLPGGRLDRGFGKGGFSRVRVGPRSRTYSAVIRPQGRILLAGDSGPIDTPRFSLVQLRSTGIVDRSFSHDGIWVRSFGTSAHDAVVDRLRRPVVVGGGRRNDVKGFVVTRLRR